MSDTNSFNLLDNLLIAMPGMQDPIFKKTVAYICEHNSSGAIGLIINRLVNMDITELFKQMNIDYDKEKFNQATILLGGPLQTDRGFIIHEPGGKWKSSLQTGNNYSITTSKDIIESMAKGFGPKNSLVVLGYSAWDSEQLLNEVMQNSWMHCPASKEIIFDTPLEQRWEKALHSIGVTHTNIVDEPGHA